MLAQMLVRAQTFMFPRLELSHSILNARDLHVLAIGLKVCTLIQELRINNNCIGAAGATSLADVLQSNTPLLLLDLRSNKIRGPGTCALTDAMRTSSTLTELDLRWNFSGEQSDYVDAAVQHLQRFCFRNFRIALSRYCLVVGETVPSTSSGKSGRSCSSTLAPRVYSRNNNVASSPRRGHGATQHRHAF